MARRTLAEYRNEVRHALGASPSSTLNVDSIINDALRMLCDEHRWQWLTAGPVQLSLVQDQPFVPLPADFGEVISLTQNRLWEGVMLAMTLDQIQLLRSQSPSIDTLAFRFHYAINSNATQPRIELYPTPRSNEADAITLLYRRVVPDLAQATDVPEIPRSFDVAFMWLCRAHALELEDDDSQSAARDRYEETIRRLMQRDGDDQSDLGPMQGGAASVGHGVYGPFQPRIVPDP